MFKQLAYGALTFISICFIISPLVWVYPYYPYDRTVVTVEGEKVIYHPFGIWRQLNPHSIDFDGEVLLHGEIHELRAINNGVIGVAQIQHKYHFDVVKYCNDPTSPSCTINTCGWLKEQTGVADWNLLKSWIGQGMPEGAEKEKLIHKYLGYLFERGITPEVKLTFRPDQTSSVRY